VALHPCFSGHCTLMLHREHLASSTDNNSDPQQEQAFSQSGCPAATARCFASRRLTSTSISLLYWFSNISLPRISISTKCHTALSAHDCTGRRRVTSDSLYAQQSQQNTA
jgi:hypothetical protein